MKKQTIKEYVIERLKEGWHSYFQLQMLAHSSSADREVRALRANPPEGYMVLQRPKKILVEGQRPCLEFRLVEEENAESSNT